MQKLCKKLKYAFKKEQLLEIALNHPSIHNMEKDCKDYQRLEMLGDSVLSLIIVETLLERFQDMKEGDAHIRKVELVCGKTLSSIATKIGVGKYIKMSRSEENQNGRHNPKILEDVMESIIGAIYKDGGLIEARKFVLYFWKDLFGEDKILFKDPKTRLQEFLQKRHKQIPQYISEELINNGVDTSYRVLIKIAKFPDFEVIAKTKKEGEVEVAEKVIEYIKKERKDRI
ncbi:MAG: ribonuclease III [Rickettsiales bacterium]|jgi:ribonuclease-3|nr:ribonuclease III [Rickettsiales bacterium]